MYCIQHQPATMRIPLLSLPRRALQLQCKSVSSIPIMDPQELSTTLQRQGFCQTMPLLSESTCRALHKRIPPLFAGHFETGVYPDEWHWRQGLSREEVTREMCNVWKSDRLVASIVLQESLGQLVASIMKWQSVRLAQDDLIWKAPATATTTIAASCSVVGFHQDAAYISSQFEPLENNSVTVWIALDDVDDETGCVQYAPGSHLWKLKDCTTETSFHGGSVETYLSSLPQDATVVSVPVSQGCAIVHHQNIWHGSGPNRSKTRNRRALVGHYLRGDVQFRADDTVQLTPWGRTSYIYGRYKRFQSVEVDENFFPIVYASSGQVRTSWLDEYIEG